MYDAPNTYQQTGPVAPQTRNPQTAPAQLQEPVNRQILDTAQGQIHVESTGSRLQPTQTSMSQSADVGLLTPFFLALAAVTIIIAIIIRIAKPAREQETALTVNETTAAESTIGRTQSNEMTATKAKKKRSSSSKKKSKRKSKKR